MAERADNLWLLVIRLTLVALVAAVYWPAAGFGYVQYDDLDYINPVVRQGLTTAGVEWAFDLAGHVANWHPVTWLSLMLDTSVFGDSAAWHHVVNIALHAVNVLLLLGLLRTMTGMVWRSAMVAALLAVHPMHVESVAWVSERKDVLSMMFWLLTMRAYVTYTRDASVPRYLLVMALFALGLMSKPMVVTLPAALLLLDIWPLDRLRNAARLGPALCRLVAEKVPLVAMSVAVSAVTVKAQSAEGKLTEGVWMALPDRLETSVVGYARYLGKLFWPADLAAIYPNLGPLGIDQWSTAQVAGASGLVVVLSLAAALVIRRMPYVFVGWFWFVGTLTPVIGFVQMGRQSIADRYAYIPYVGLYIALVWLAGDALDRWPAMWRRACAAAACGLIVTLAVAAHRQVYVWKDSVTVFAHAVSVTTDNWMMLNNLAGVLEQEGRRDEALERLREATGICRECGWVHSHLGEMLLRAGRTHEAQAALERAIAVDPTYAPAHANLALLLSQKGDVSGAVSHMQRVVELQPRLAEARKNLAIGLALSGRKAEAIEQAREAARLDPAHVNDYGVLIETIESGLVAPQQP